jgi:ATP-dependent DNA helicase RecG
MAGETFQVTEDQVRRILHWEEDHFGDVKAKALTPAKMSESVSAFGNADGGELWLGIDEDSRTKARTWLGFDRIEDANPHLDILSGLFPFGTSYSFEFLTNSIVPGYVLHIEVPKARLILEATNGTAYVRKGAQNLPVNTPDKRRQLEHNKGITTYETETINTAPDIITNSATTIEFILDVIPSAEPEEWFRKQQVIVDDKPTVSGAVLFADEPQALLPKRCGIKVYRYQTTDADPTRPALVFEPLSMEGSAYSLIASTVAKTQDIIGGISKLGEHRLETVTYPPETLHEIITNAVLHRDYSIPDDIHVRIFDNRVEVESPGLLPGHVTEKNILKERFARNPMIVRLINKFPNPPNKDVGEGLNTAFQAMRTMRLRDPEIKQGENSVVVYIRHTRLASSEDAIMNYLETHDEITNAITRNITGIPSENSIKNVFTRLSQRKMIERVPGKLGRASAWRKFTAKPVDPSPTQGKLLLD